MERSKMTEQAKLLILGTDEAGYGPNLGPLLLGCSCWRLTLDEDAKRLRDAFLPPVAETPEPKKPTKKKKPLPTGPTLFDFEQTPTSPPTEYDREFTLRAMAKLNAALAPISSRKGLFPLVDSKKLYTSGALAPLERSFLLAAALVERSSITNATFRTVVKNVARESDATPAPPWETEYDAAIPLDAKTLAKLDLDDALRQIEALMQNERIALCEIGARRVQPAEFNALVDRLGLKSDLISDVTLSCVAETLGRAVERESESSEPLLCLALCDKLGGRDRYLPALTQRFPGAEIRVVEETRAVSVYRLIANCGKDRDGNVVKYRSPIALEIRFTAKGEANAPTALASICAKYFRELSMEAFNAYWRAQLGDALRPTAGYPVDAARFRDEVDEKRNALGIDDAIFWRKK